MSRNCLWDRYWGLAGQLLAIGQFSPILSNRLETVDPDVFVKVHSYQFASVS